MAKHTAPPAPPPMTKQVIAPEIKKDGVNAPEVSVMKQAKGFVLCEGKSVTCGTVRTILGPGDEITAAHLSTNAERGEASLKALVKAKIVKAVG